MLVFPRLFALTCMGKFDYPSYGRERCNCYSLFERQHDVIGKGLGFGVKKTKTKT